MNNTAQQLIDSNVYLEKLPFGITENVVLSAVSVEDKKRDGLRVKRNTFMTFSQIEIGEDGVRKVLTKSDFDFWDIKPDKYATTNMIDMLGKLNAIIGVLTPKKKCNLIKSYSSKKEISAALKTEKTCVALAKSIGAAFYEHIKDVIGLDSTLMRIKVVTDKTGKFQNLPKEARFVESISAVPLEDSVLEVENYELERYEEYKKPKKEDSISEEVSEDNVLDLG